MRGQDYAARQEAIANLGRIALAEHDLQSLMDQTVQLVAKTLDVELCKVLRLLPERKSLVLQAGVGWRPETGAVIGTATVGAGLDSQAGYTLHSSGPVVVRDLRTETRFTGPRLLHDHGVVSGMSVVIKGGDGAHSDGPYGVLGVHTKHQRTFTQDDINFLQSIANVLASAIDRQRYESQLQAHQHQLEELVAHRTAELEQSHQRLRFSERMAALGTLSAGLGHDMGNLLLPVRLRLDVMESRGLSPEMKEDVQSIRKCTEYLQRLVNGLRLFALDPDDPMASSTAAMTTNLQDWWADVQPFLRNTLPRGVRLEHEFEPNLQPLKIARHMLTQAVFNLVQNAGDALRSRGSGTVAIRAHKDSDESGAAAVTIIVLDDGPGMSPEVLRRCTEPFFTTKTRSLSTGLGLALVHGIIHKTGGSVNILSQEGVGTQIRLSVPSAGSIETAGVQRAEGAGPDAAFEPILGRYAVVTLSDPRLRAYVSAVLHSFSFRVKVADQPNGSGASLWVIDAALRDLSQVRCFVDSGRHRRALVFGHVPDELRTESIVEMVERTRPAAIRQVLQHLAAEMGKAL